MIEVVWRGIETPSTEHCQVVADAAGVHIRSVIKWKTQVWVDESRHRQLGFSHPHHQQRGS